MLVSAHLLMQTKMQNPVVEEATRSEREPLQEPQGATTRRKRRRDTSIDTLVKVLQEAKKERAERFNKKMSLLERLVAAVEAKPTQSE